MKTIGVWLFLNDYRMRIKHKSKFREVCVKKRVHNKSPHFHLNVLQTIVSEMDIPLTDMYIPTGDRR